MEVRQLQTFCVLAEELNFTRTAERVFTVQSNVTSQIKALEGELGVPLFDRLSKRVVLTEAGRRFRPYAEKALAAMDQGYRAISMSDAIDAEHLTSMGMRKEDVYLFSTPDHPLANAKKACAKDLVDQTLLLTESGCGYRKKLDTLLAAANVKPQHVTEFSSVEAIKQCVHAGMGIGFLPE